VLSLRRLWYVDIWRRFAVTLAVRLLASCEKDEETSANTVQGTTDVRLDPQLNKKVWEAGIKGVPFRLRVRISRKRNDEDGAKEKLYSYVQAVNVKDPKGLHTQVVEDA
jgi:large subunit ribosomal protein L31e